MENWNIIFPHQKRHYFNRAILKDSILKRKRPFLMENSPEGKKSYLLLGLSFHYHSQRKTYLTLEGSDQEELLFFYSTSVRAWCRWCLPNRICLVEWAALWKSNRSTCHLWMSVIWGQWPALYFLNPAWTENVFGLYCVTSPSLWKGPRGEGGRVWLFKDGSNAFSCYHTLLIVITCFMVSFPAAPKIHCNVF